MDGLEVFEQHRDEIDVVVLDVIMPEMDSPSLLRRLRALDPAIPAVFISGFSPEVVTATGDDNVSRAPVEFVSKPFGSTQLISAIRLVTAGHVLRGRALIATQLFASPPDEQSGVACFPPAKSGCPQNRGSFSLEREVKVGGRAQRSACSTPGSIRVEHAAEQPVPRRPTNTKNPDCAKPARFARTDHPRSPLHLT
jgi:CheY-like chemotaxis protein